MPGATVKQAKSLEVFLKYAAAHAKMVRVHEWSKIEETTAAGGKKTLLPQTVFRLVAALPEQNVSLVFEERYVNRGRGFEDASGEIVKAHELKLRGAKIRAALEQHGLEVREVHR